MYKRQEENHTKRNREACRKIVTNALFCFKNSMSATDFVKLNDDKDQMFAIESSPVATKNDGQNQFFQLRDEAYVELSRCIKSEFASVRSASFTLDKVTVGQKPFTVLLTYYFSEGEIKAFLNHLHPMRSDEYSGMSTANMVGTELMRSLAIARHRIGQVFHHSVYDGV